MVRLDKISYLVTSFKPYYKDKEQYQYSTPASEYNFDLSIYLLLKRMGVFPKITTNKIIDENFPSSIPHGREEYLLMNIKNHCQDICLIDNPKCSKCIMSLHCDFYNKKNDWTIEL